ncbi:EthD domain-containing protein [Sphingomonas jatrophae]|uniref:EthD domain-containing protein n=1 Tax=Sphingomonas jatrophae TaxID=1166337 RepID=A0A1I6M3R9_9SPHN|nr:EthD domain-containing protein [Sphingomonas jatrophae]SFS10377.1 EthD domain-containing protein [Sphingomonas jatrophae]
MFKVMGLIRRRGDLPPDAFRLHWRTIHRGLALRIAEAGLLAGYVQNHKLDIPVDGLEIVADGVPELWFADAEAFAALRSHAAFRDGAFHDEPNFMDISDYRSQPLTEEIGTGAPRRECVGLLKAILFLHEGEPGLPGHGAVRTARQTRPATPLPIKVAPYVAVETSWWHDLATFRRAWADHDGPARGLLAEERVVFWPGDPSPPADWRPVPPTRAQA